MGIDKGFSVPVAYKVIQFCGHRHDKNAVINCFVLRVFSKITGRWR